MTHGYPHIPWSKTPPMPKCVEPGQGVRGETLGPKETIIPPKAISGTVNLPTGITKEEWNMEQMRMKLVEEDAKSRAINAMKEAKLRLNEGCRHQALMALQEARRIIDCLRKGDGR